MTEETFQSKFSVIYNKFSSYPLAQKFIDEKLIMNREKSVAFYTKHIFTVGHTGSIALPISLCLAIHCLSFFSISSVVRFSLAFALSRDIIWATWKWLALFLISLNFFPLINFLYFRCSGQQEIGHIGLSRQSSDGCETNMFARGPSFSIFAPVHKIEKILIDKKRKEINRSRINTGSTFNLHISTENNYYMYITHVNITL